MPEQNKKPSHRLFIARDYENGGVNMRREARLNIQPQAASMDGRCVALRFEQPKE